MNTQPLFRVLQSVSLLTLAASAPAADFRWIGAADATSLDNAANWDFLPSGASSVTPDSVVVGSGDRVLMQQTGGGPANHLGIGPADVVTVQGGGRLTMDGGGWGPSFVNSQVNLAPGGTVETIGGSGETNRLTNITLTGTNSTSYLVTDARMDIREGAMNSVDFGSNNTLEQSTTNGQGLNFVFTQFLGSGTLKMTGGSLSLEDGFAGSPSVTIDATNTNVTSWSGVGDTIVSPIILRNSQLNGRYDDAGKVYAGSITIPTGNTGTINPELNGNPGGDQSIVITGQVTGGGTLNKISGGTLTLTNGSNNHSGGTVIAGGTLVAAANNVLGTGPLQLNAGATLDTGTFSQGINGGTLSGNVTGTGGVQLTGGTTAISSTTISVLGLAGGTAAPTVNNALGASGGTVNVTENSVLKPSNQSLNLHFESGNNDGAQNDAYGNGLHINDSFNPNALLGSNNGTVPGQVNISQIDSTSKPYGNYTRISYTAKLVNTGSTDIQLSFGEQYDDEARVVIDGVDVLNDTGWNTATSTSNRIGQPGINGDGTFTLTPGAHDIVIQAFDGWGGAGPNSGWNKGIGWREGAWTITDPAGGADNAQFMNIGVNSVPNSALKFADGQDKTFNQNFAIASGKTLTVDTSEMLGGNKVILTGVLSGAGGGLTKTGAGTLQLNGISTYTGQTLVAQGTLLLAAGASLNPSSEITIAAGATLDASASSLTVGAGQTLDGNGTVVGNTTVDGTIAPGNSIGTLTISGNLTLNGISSMELDRTGPAISDEINVSGSLDFGGTLNVSLLGGSLQLGDTFDLFDAGSVTGTFDGGVNLPALGGDWYWDTGSLYTLGSIQVLPEPSSATFALLAALGFLGRRRRK
jgi:autotransporter-associated beta strand protein